jgi:enterochelin esterase-like enzyme
MPDNVAHKTFYSKTLNHEIGYNIYLPPDYPQSARRYPSAYHIHGWRGNESSDIWPLEKAYKNRQAITVFVNSISSRNEYYDALSQIELILIHELIPHIDERYRTNTTRENRSLSGFSMGGATAFYFAVKHSELFGSVTSYAGTFHHQYHKDYQGVGKPPEAAVGLYEAMIRERRYLEEKNILCLVNQNAEKIRGNLRVNIHIGTEDILICDNEIMCLFLDSLHIPHVYKKFACIGHKLAEIL